MSHQPCAAATHLRTASAQIAIRVLDVATVDEHGSIGWIP